MRLAIGAYTDAEHPCGLQVVSYDGAAARFSVEQALEVSNALYQARSSDGRWLYSCTGEGLASFSCEGGRLAPCRTCPVGNCLCHVALMPGEKQLVWADYLAGQAGSVAVEDGRFGTLKRFVHTGQGPNLPRQDKAHCHQALPGPDGRSYYVVDLGLDRIVRYPQGRVLPTAPAGAGPRHLLFHPDGETAFLVYELGNLVSLLRVTPQGDLTVLHTCATLPPEGPSRGPNGDLAAAIRLTPDGERLVVSNRGEQSLVTFAVDREKGRLTEMARTILPGSWPRDFVFAAADLAFVTLERSGDLLALDYDAATGRFRPRAALSGLYRPVAVTCL